MAVAYLCFAFPLGLFWCKLFDLCLMLLRYRNISDYVYIPWIFFCFSYY